MKRTFTGAIAGLLLIFPLVLRADISQTVTLSSNTTLNLDTGNTAASGGDVQWNGSTITPQGAARVYSFPSTFTFSGLTEAQLSVFKILASSTPIAPSSLAVNDVFAVYTNGGHNAKVVVTANSGGSITLQFLTYIAAVSTNPTISAIQNNSSRIPVGLPSYGIAPSSLFVIVGTGLADSGTPVLQDTVLGLPLTLNGASVSVTVNGVTTYPPIYYTSPTQIAAVLPAATPVGTGTLTVNHNGVVSSNAAIRVVPSAPGITTYQGSGVAQDASTFALISYTNSVKPGDTIILWGTGLGADPDDSDTTYTSTPHQVQTALQIYIGTVQANIVYQGASVYPGVDVIGLTIPQSAPTGCWVPVAVLAGNIVGNFATLPINTSGGACVEPGTGLTGNQIAPQGGQTLRTGLVTLVQAPEGKNAPRSNSANAAFVKYDGIYTPNNPVSQGNCIANNLMPATVGNITGLDVGTVTLAGPAGLSVTLASQFGIKGTFNAILSATAIPATGGTFTFKGSGGADVGPFTTSFNLSNPLIAWTNQSDVASIDRSKSLKITWTGGNPGSSVYISGTSTVPGTTTLGEFQCLASADAGQFTIPSFILGALPVGSGGINVQNDILAPLSATGIDIGQGQATISYNAAASFK